MSTRIAKLFDDIYSREAVSGGGVDPLIEEALEYGIEGRALDVGAGNGLQSIALAREGIEVDAIDLSPVGVNNLRQYARQNNLPIRVRVGNVCTSQIDGQYGAIVACNVLKYVPCAKFQDVVAMLQEHTLSGGLHLLRMQTDSPLWRYCQWERELVAFEPTMITLLYRGWLVRHVKTFGTSVPINAGRPMFLLDHYVDLMLQKP